MTWRRASLHDVLQIKSSPITLLEQSVYKQATVYPYPRGPVLKVAKRGFDFPNRQKHLICAGQFIISRVRAYRNIWGLVPPELDGAIVIQEYLTFNLHPNLHPGYLAAYLSTSMFRQSVRAACTQKGRLQIRQFGNISLSLPSWEEQCRVAEVWTLANAASEQTGEMFSGISAIKAGVIHDLLSTVNASWEQKTLGECAVIRRDTTGKHPLSFRPPDQIIAGMGGDIGITPNNEVDSLFLYHYLDNQREKLRSKFNGAKSGTEEVLRTFPILLPSLYEQRKIAAIAQQHDEALLRLRAEQAALRRLTQGITDGLVSGTLDLQEAMPGLRIALGG